MTSESVDTHNPDIALAIAKMMNVTGWTCDQVIDKVLEVVNTPGLSQTFTDVCYKFLLNYRW